MKDSILKKLFKNKIYFTYVRAFALMIVILFFLNALSIGVTIQKARNQNIEAGKLAIMQEHNRLNQSFNYIRQYAQELAMDTNLNSFNIERNEPLDNVDLSKTIREMCSREGIREYISMIYVYIPKDDTVFYKNGKFPIKRYYEMAIKEGGEDYYSWKNRMSKSYYNEYNEGLKYYDGSNVIDIIEYKQSYPLGGVPKGNIVFVLNRKLFDSYCNVPFKNNKALYVLDANDRVIYHAGNEKYKLKSEYINMDGDFYSEKMSSTMIFKSEERGFKYISVEKADAINKSLVGVLIFDFICILAFVVVGIILSLRLAYKIANPIIKIENTLNSIDGSQSSDGFENLQERIIGAFESKIAADKIIKEQKQIIKNSLLRKLLRKSDLNQTELSETLLENGIVFDKTGFVVADIIICSYEDIYEKTIILIEELIKRQIYLRLKDICACEAIDDNMEELILIFNVDDKEKTVNDIVNVLSLISEQILKDYSVDVNINIGDIHTFEHIYRSYYEAKECSEYRMYSGTRRILLYSKLKNSRSNYVYNSEKENEFMRYVVMGNAERALECFDSMITLHEDCSLVVIRCLYFNLIGTMFKILDSGNIVIAEEIERKHDFNKLLECHGVVELQQEIRMMIKSICQDVNAYSSDKKNNLINAILLYIENNYSDNGMSLEMIADEFELNFTYVSHFIKEQTGENFVNYLTGLRIKKAKEMLLDANVSIAQIASDVGYANSTVFIRNFKRVEGITPGKYREQWN